MNPGRDLRVGLAIAAATLTIVTACGDDDGSVSAPAPQTTAGSVGAPSTSAASTTAATTSAPATAAIGSFEGTIAGATTDPAGGGGAAGEMLLFTRARAGYGEATLFVADADGTNERLLLESGDIECCPWVGRDGSRVVFAVVTPDGQIAPGVINIDGSAYQVFDLPQDGLNLGAGPFTPDNTRIAFEGFHPTDPAAAGIYTGSATDGSGLSRVTDQHDIPGDFSPDGTRLAFHRPTSNTEASPLSGTLMIVDLDGLAGHQVTPNGMIIQCCPRWSPDGSRILFEDPAGSLWLINPDGSNLSEIFDGGADNGYAIDPAWSPDGSHIAFALDSGPDPFSHPTNEVILINADGTGATTVIATKDHKRDIWWLPTSGG